MLKISFLNVPLPINKIYQRHTSETSSTISYSKTGLGRYANGPYHRSTTVQRKTVILVILDRFSKACHLGMLPTNFTACKTTELFTSIFCRHHRFLPGP